MIYKNIGITGGLGFIGTNLVKKIVEISGINIKILDNLSNTSKEDITGLDYVLLVEGDIRDRKIVDEFMEDIDVVIHLAAHTRVIDSIEEPLLNFDINCNGTLQILESARRNNIQKIIAASTGGAILGDVKPPINEDIVAYPASPYGASKLSMEGYCSAYYGSYGLKYNCLRFSNIYGPYSVNKESVVAKFIKDITKTEEVNIYGDGKQTRDYLYVDDLIKGILQALENDVVGVYQLGSGVPTTINDLLSIIRNVIPIDFEVKYQEARKGEVKHTYCDIDKAKTDFEYMPGTSLEEGIEKTWEWYKTKI